MAYLIDKDALVAEIERLIFVCDSVLWDKDASKSAKEVYKERKAAYTNVLSFINTYEVKEVEEEPVSIWHNASEPVVGNNPKLLLYDPKNNWIDIHAYSKCKIYINESKCKWAYVEDLLKL